MRRPCVLAVVLGALSFACGPAAPPQPAVRLPSTLAAAHYEVTATSLAPCVLDVEVRLAGGADELRAAAPGGVETVTVRDRRGARSVARVGDRFAIACDGTCTARYSIDLDAVAAASGNSPRVAVRTGDDVVSPAATWILRPGPMVVDLPITVAVREAPEIRFATGIDRRLDGALELRSQELASAGYTAFGRFENQRVAATEGVVDVAVLGGSTTIDREAVAQWVGDSARTLDHVFDRFPVRRAQVFVVPEPRTRAVDFGRTLPSGGASILMYVGEHATREDLDDDWILIHELFHLGVPSFWQEGRWLDEGLATYYEPVLRTRAGLISEPQMWQEFAEGMPRGLPGPAEPVLTLTTDHERVYWGGATFALLADVQIRRRTRGKRSLDHGLRAVLARGGHASRIWTVERFLEVIDEAVGVPVMRELHRRASVARPAACQGELAILGACPGGGRRDLDGLLADLGVGTDRHGKLSFDEGAPLAALRREIGRASPPGGRDAPRSPHGAGREVTSPR